MADKRLLWLYRGPIRGLLPTFAAQREALAVAKCQEGDERVSISTTMTRSRLLPADAEWAAALVALWQAEDDFDAADPDCWEIANKRLTAARLRAEAAAEQARRRQERVGVAG